jgi:osmotically inducible protein OsmC
MDDGDGEVRLDSGVWSGIFATPDVADATDPEELLAAAQASCFAMTASYVLEQAGYSPEHLSTQSVVTLNQDKEGFSIPLIKITVGGTVPDATAAEFAAIMEEVEAACPVSQALAGTEIEVSASSEI